MALPKIRTTLTVTLDRDNWSDFQAICKARKTSASKEIGAFLRQEITQWVQRNPSHVLTSHLATTRGGLQSVGVE